MRTIGGISLVVAGLLLALTALLLRGTAPDVALHQRTMAALHELVLQDAALQRDVLKARTGLLPDYDFLVRATASLHAATAELQDAPRIATGEAAAAIAQRQAALADAVAAQEKAVEAFKSENALLQNSLRYVGHLTEQLAAVLPSAPNSSAPDVTAFAGTMLRLDTDASVGERRRPQSRGGPGGSARSGIAASGGSGGAGSPRPPDSRQGVISGRHGRRMLEWPIAVRAGELQADYLAQHGRAESRATWSQRLLYAAAVGLLGWLAWPVLRLRASTWRLEVKAPL